jgi:hypothetical protein
VVRLLLGWMTRRRRRPGDVPGEASRLKLKSSTVGGAISENNSLNKKALKIRKNQTPTQSHEQLL